MKARIDYFCAPIKKGSGYELENIHIFVDLPFIPAVGTALKLTKDGDFMEVADVMLDITPGGEGLCIGLKEPEFDVQIYPWPEMKKQGWLLG